MTSAAASASKKAQKGWQQGFHRLSIEDRRARLEQGFPDVKHPWQHPAGEGSLGDATANRMVENCFGTLALPLAIALNMKVNGQTMAVPMAGEEPSVVAAVSGVGKLVAANGGFEAEEPRSNMVAQIQVLDCVDVDEAAEALRAQEGALMAKANEFLQNMVKRGGGAQGIEVRVLRAEREGEIPMVVLHVIIDVGDAMGANMCNTVAEGIAPMVASLTGGRVGLRILSNLADRRIATARFSIPVDKLAYKGFSGAEIARGMLEANAFALQDPYRAATNNKGIMNGVDAALVASGQDYRAVEAGAHAYAARDGRYRSLSRYKVEDGCFKGEIAMPMQVGTVGGALQTHPTYRYVHALLGHPNAPRLAAIMVCVGLAQNFAAMRALVSEGINKGHMRLQARSVCAAAGVPEELCEMAIQAMIDGGKINVEAAKNFLVKYMAKTGTLRVAGKRGLATANAAFSLSSKL